MISQYDVIEYFKKDKSVAYYNEETRMIIDSETNEPICSLEYYTDETRKKLHCSFEGLFHCPGSLLSVLKCTECGTVIFSSDCCEDYDDNLKCPTCSGERCSFDYWTEEDIKNNIKKQNTLDYYKESNKRDLAIYEREQKTGLGSSEVWKIEFNINGKMYRPKLCVFSYMDSKLRGLHFEMDVIKNGENTYEVYSGYRFPLGVAYLYIMHLYPLIKKFKN